MQLNRLTQAAVVLVFVGSILIVANALGPVSYDRTAESDGHYMAIMKNISTPEVKAQMLSVSDEFRTYFELYEWIRTPNSQVMKFRDACWLETRPEDPLAILQSGHGACEEYSILYTALCLAHGYEARMVVSYGPETHAWSEVKLYGTWIMVDASSPLVNQPYRRFDNGRDMTQIFAYGPDYVEDVTQNYRRD